MNELFFSGEDLFTVVLKRNSSDQSIAEYLVDAEKPKNKMKTYRKKYLTCTKILAKILTSYYGETPTAEFFPNYTKRKYKASAKEPSFEEYLVGDYEGNETIEREKRESEFPEMKEKIWNRLEFLYLILLMSAVESLLPKTTLIDVVLNRVDQRPDTGENVVANSPDTLNRNKDIFIDSISKDILEVLDTVNEYDTNRLEKDDPFNQLIVDILEKFESATLCYHLSLFYNSCLNMLFPKIDDYTERDALSELQLLTKKISEEATDYLEMYDNFMVETSKECDNLRKQLSGDYNIEKRRNNYQEIESDLLILQEKINDLL